MTLYGPFAETTPSGQTGWVDERRRTATERAARMLTTLDGVERLTYSVWRGTRPESIVVRSSDVGESFVQAAGSAEAMTVEVRLPGPDGRGHLHTVGKQAPVSEDSVLIPTSAERAVRVFSNEVFTADEAADVFAQYIDSGAVGEPFTLRERDLSVAQSEQR
jgi:hypothetical protein